MVVRIDSLLGVGISGSLTPEFEELLVSRRGVVAEVVGGDFFENLGVVCEVFQSAGGLVGFLGDAEVFRSLRRILAEVLRIEGAERFRIREDGRV